MPTEFDRVLAEGAALLERLADLRPVAVGGTAVALHCDHRFSLDVDVVSPDLAARYKATIDRLESWEAWQTNRTNPPVLILGERHGVELGVRQQRRTVPLRVQRVSGLVIPTIREMLRIKAFLLSERRMARDFIDVAALTDRLHQAEATSALLTLNLIYPTSAPQSRVTQFAQACESPPFDIPEVDFRIYKGLRSPFNDWEYVREKCRVLGRLLLREEMAGRLPLRLDRPPPEREEDL
jgi:hypothetical protein